MYRADLHTHSIASGHGTTDTIADMAKAAYTAGLTLLGISDHAPSTMCSGTSSYFRGLVLAPRKRCGVELLYGVELNILTYDGDVDLDRRTLSSLDYAIASLHRANIHPGTTEENTSAYIGAMKNPYISIIGHPDDDHFPVDIPALVRAARDNHVLLEINNSSLSPGGYRGNAAVHDREILKCCRSLDWPVLLSSDSHGRGKVGDFSYADALLKECNFPEELVLNHDTAALKRFLVR